MYKNKLFALLISIFLLVAVRSDSFMLEGCNQPAGETCPDCSGTAYMIWSCASTDVTSDGGCADEDTSATLTGNTTVSGGYLIFNDTGSNGVDYATFDPCDDTTLMDEVTIFIKFKYDEWDANSPLFKIMDSGGNDYLAINTLGSDNAGNLIGLCDHASTIDTVVLDDGDIQEGVWYIVRYRVDVDATGTDHEIDLFDATGASNLDSIAEDDVLDSPAYGNDPDIFYLGNYYYAGRDYNYSIDYVHIYKEIRDDDPCAD